MKKTFLITGGSKGLGAEIALQVTDIANNLIIVSRKKTNLLHLEKKLKKINPLINVLKIVADLSLVSGVKKIIKEFKKQKKIKHVDVLVNSAAQFTVKKIKDVKLEDLKKDFQLNVISPFMLSKYFGLKMCKKKKGVILNIGSSSSYGSSKNTSIYCATKHALLGMSRSFHVELRECGVRCIIVSPGSMKTLMGKKVKNQNYRTFINPVDAASIIKQIITNQNNMVIDEIKLNRMKYN